MPSARGQASARARVTRASIATGVIIGVLAAALTAAAAGATSISQKKAQAQAAEAQLNTLSRQAEHAVEVYDGIHQRYENTLAALRLNQETLKVARHNLAAAQRQLAASLTADYKSGDQDAISYMLAARSIGDLVDQVQVLQRTTGVDKNLLGDISKYQGEVVRREKLLKKQERRGVPSRTPRRRSVTGPRPPSTGRRTT
jgi:peptidoglycan hydrolase CwlO-like protein